MDLEFTEEQERVREGAIAFARADLQPDVLRQEPSHAFPFGLWRKCAAFGVQGLPMPKEYGGRGMDALSTVIAMEALGYGCADQGLLFSIHAQLWSVQTPICKFGTPAQKEKYLPKLCDGTWIGAHCMSEPASGSDSFHLSTSAVRKDDRYILNGSKEFVTNGPVADLLLVFATVDPTKGIWGLIAFLVETTTRGVVRGAKDDKLGLNTAQMGSVTFEDCEIPTECVLGREGQGSAIFNHSMAWERSCILASTVGAMQHQLERSTQYAKDRRQFGKPIGSFQLVASRLVDMKVRLETARLLLYQTASGLAKGDLSTMTAAIAKLYISECAVQSSLDAIQIHGARGVSKAFGIEGDLRDAMAGRIYSGTSEIQRLIIARGMGLPADC